MPKSKTNPYKPGVRRFRQASVSLHPAVVAVCLITASPTDKGILQMCFNPDVFHYVYL